jgi:hypothetical protein
MTEGVVPDRDNQGRGRGDTVLVPEADDEVAREIGDVEVVPGQGEDTVLVIDVVVREGDQEIGEAVAGRGIDAGQGIEGIMVVKGLQVGAHNDMTTSNFTVVD